MIEVREFSDRALLKILVNQTRIILTEVAEEETGIVKVRHWLTSWNT